jgi:hypothetical protein
MPSKYMHHYILVFFPISTSMILTNCYTEATKGDGLSGEDLNVPCQIIDFPPQEIEDITTLLWYGRSYDSTS